jgi:hypothetical protein
MQRNLTCWFYYLQNTFQDFFDIFAGLLDNNYSFYSDHGNIIFLSQADIFETYYSSASSADLFGLVLCLLLPELQVIITSKSIARLLI